MSENARTNVPEDTCLQISCSAFMLKLHFLFLAIGEFKKSFFFFLNVQVKGKKCLKSDIYCFNGALKRMNPHNVGFKTARKLKCKDKEQKSLFKMLCVIFILSSRGLCFLF